MGEQLKPCPFCGARAEILGTDHLPYVCCENCGGSSDEFRTAERAAEDWNRRTPSPAIKEMAEALEVSRQAIADFVCLTAPDQVEEASLAKATARVHENGRLYYLAHANEIVSAALSTYRKAEEGDG